MLATLSKEVAKAASKTVEKAVEEYGVSMAEVPLKVKIHSAENVEIVDLPLF